MADQLDQYYIEQTLKGNKHAFAFLLRKYKDLVFSIALKLLRDREEAEDIAQEIFIKAYRSLHKYKGDSKFSTWLYRIAYNSCLDKIKLSKRFSFIKKGEDNNLQIPNLEIEVLEDLECEDRKRLIKAAIASLGKEDQTLIMLYYYEDLSLIEIAEITGLKENTIKVRLHRSRGKLAHLLKGHEATLKYKNI
ncbi:RNA polymerase sigma factor [Ascidiimonas sp. W6]|uniref:RNA polymerase sigma factor n=1 Tax=Ascidiimonas meishanensis TaxID=3128903 RepID=UPI0030EC0F0C